MRSSQQGFAFLALLALPLGASRSESPSPGLATCPVTPPAANALPKGARLLGSAGAAPFKYVSLTNDTPAQIRPDSNFLAEIESGSDSRPGLVRSSTWFGSAANPVSLVCHYGGVGPVASGKAKLIIPLPANTKGECVVSSTLRAGKQGIPRVRCTRGR